MKGTVTYWQMEPHVIGTVTIRGKGEFEIDHEGALRRRGKTGICVPSDVFRKPVKVGEIVDVPVLVVETLGATTRTEEMKVKKAPVWIRSK